MAPNYYLTVAPKYVDLLCGLPAFRDLSTEQLFDMLPKRYRRLVLPASDVSHIREQDDHTRAAIIGMLATETQIEHYLAQKFMTNLSA